MVHPLYKSRRQHYSTSTFPARSSSEAAAFSAGDLRSEMAVIYLIRSLWIFKPDNTAVCRVRVLLLKPLIWSAKLLYFFQLRAQRSANQSHRLCAGQICKSRGQHHIGHSDFLRPSVQAGFLLLHKVVFLLVCHHLLFCLFPAIFCYSLSLYLSPESSVQEYAADGAVEMEGIASSLIPEHFANANFSFWLQVKWARRDFLLQARSMNSCTSCSKRYCVRQTRWCSKKISMQKISIFANHAFSMIGDPKD